METFISKSSHIALVLDNARLTITLNNPEMRNRLSSADIQYLIEVLRQVDREHDIRVVVLTGAGKTFCAGFDLNELGDLAGEAKLPNFDELTDTVEQLRCPIICALNGGVYGGGVDLALACDFRIVVDDAELLMPAAKIGLHYYPNGVRRYVSRLGMAATKRLLLCATPVTASQLLDIGFADQLVPRSELESVVDTLATTLRNNAPLAVEGMKYAINHYGNAQVDDKRVRECFEFVLQSSDFKEGITSVKNKTQPLFKRC